MNADAEHGVRQARDELAKRKIVLVTIGSLLTTAIALVVAGVLLGRWGQERRHEGIPSAPRTIGILEQTLVLHTARGVELRDRQRASLSRWEWIDRDGGVIQIPIDVAIDMLAASPPPPDRPLAEVPIGGGARR